MAIKILTPPNPILTKKAQKIKKINPELKKFIDQMANTMRQSDGMGLAAPQIGRSIQLAVVEYIPNEDSPVDWPAIPLKVLINPKIIKASRQQIIMEEGCLSVPNRQINIKRPKSVEILNHTLDGRRYRLRAEGLLARICQHEIDHLNGTLITDHQAQPEPSQDKTLTQPY